MLVGSSPFVGETATDSIGAVLHKNLDLDRLPPATPANVRRVLARCLERDKALRYRDIGDVRIELERPGEHAYEPIGRASAASRLLLISTGVLLLIAVGGWLWVALQPAGSTPKPSPTLELSIPMPKGHEVVGPIAISRDGGRIAFVSEDESGESRLLIRELDRFEFIEVPRSRDAWNPAFSPDGRTIVFKGRDGLYRAPVDGGGPSLVVKTPSSAGTCVLDDGSIVYSTGVDSPLWRIPAGGGAPVAVTDLAAIPGTYAHVWPQPIPGTNKLLLTCWGNNNIGGARITDTETGAVREILKNPTASFVPPARWVASGHLILEAWGTLIAVPFDPETGGNFDQFERNQVLTSVAHLGNATRCVFDVSDDGTLAYVPAEPANPRLVWINADGTVETVLEQDDSLGFFFGGNLAVSPDGTQALIGTQDIAVIDLTRRIPRRLTYDQANDFGPVWSSDGSKVYFNSNREDRWAVWSVAATGVGDPELVYKSENSIYVNSAGPNGLLCFNETTSDAGDDLWIIEPGGKARPLVRTRFDEHSGAFSADGRFVAYVSDISGRDEIYVISSSDGGQPVQITTGGGQAPKWGPLGTSLYYRVGRSIMRIPMADGRPKDEPERVFKGPTLNGGRMYSLSPDETRLLAIETPEAAIRDEIRVITNFFDRVREVAGPGSRQEANQ
jgi:Tol biopolymer transport system component